MSLTLLVESNAKIESFYMLNLSTWLGLETVTEKKADFALKYIETTGSKIQLIIARAHIEKEHSAKRIIDFLKSKNLNIPVIVIGPGEEVPGAFAHVPNSLQLKILIKSAALALNITPKDMMNKVVPDYFPIPITYFQSLKRSVCPVYSRDLENVQKFQLRIERLKEFDAMTISLMIKEGVDYLYVNKLDRLDFVNNVTAELMALLAKEEVSEDEFLSAGEKTLELLSKKLMTIGITEETIHLAKKSIEDMKHNVKINPNLSRLIARLLSNKTSYLYKHTQLLTYVCLHMVENIDWGTPEQEEKISFIAFFHDIALETDEQGKIKSLNELKASEITSEEKQLVEKHAQIAAEFVSKFPHAPMGADQIIRQHHGNLNGVGFSDHYAANISPMAVIFIVAEEFTRIILKWESGPFDRVQMLRELKDEFNSPRFQKMIDHLKNITF